MSAPRQLVAWLWAVVWLRWRLVGAKARRLAGGRPAAAASGYHLAAADVPVQGVDYDVDELPPELLARLEDARTALLDHARRAAAQGTHRRRARRRRTSALATAMLVTLAVVGGGATALVTGSTGVPAVDRLLGIYEAELDGTGAPGPRGGDLEPLSPGASSSVEVPVGDGSRRIVSSSYVARDGNVCSAVTDRGGPDRVSLGSVACIAPGTLAQRLAEDGGHLLAVNTHAEGVVVTGFVSGRATAIAGRGPGGVLDVRLGAPWEPGLPGVGPLKPFVAAGKPGPGESGREPDGAEGFGALDFRQYVFEAVTDDGGRLRIGP